LVVAESERPVSRLVLPSLSHGASQVLERVLCVAQETHFRFEKSESNASFNCAPSQKSTQKFNPICENAPDGYIFIKSFHYIFHASIFITQITDTEFLKTAVRHRELFCQSEDEKLYQPVFQQSTQVPFIGDKMLQLFFQRSLARSTCIVQISIIGLTADTTSVPAR
jgi:hypothetical protein